MTTSRSVVSAGGPESLTFNLPTILPSLILLLTGKLLTADHPTTGKTWNHQSRRNQTIAQTSSKTGDSILLARGWSKLTTVSMCLAVLYLRRLIWFAFSLQCCGDSCCCTQVIKCSNFRALLHLHQTFHWKCKCLFQVCVYVCTKKVFLNGLDQACPIRRSRSISRSQRYYGYMAWH